MTEVFMSRISDRLHDRIQSRFITSLIPTGKVIFMDDFNLKTPSVTFVPYNGKIADITHADTDPHYLTLANPQGTGAISGETRKIVAIISKAVRMSGSGYFYEYPNEGTAEKIVWSAGAANQMNCIIADGTQRLKYSLSVANDDWDLYCLGYVVAGAVDLKWDSAVVGAGTITRDTVDAFEGDAALKVTTTSGANDETKAFRTVGQRFYQRGPLGIELWLNPKSISVGSDVQLGFQWYDGVNVRSAVLKCVTGAVNPGWYVKEGGGWQMFSDYPTLTRLRAFHYHHVKLVADLVANKYCWAFIDGLFFDLSSHATDVSASSVTDALEFFVKNTNNGVGTAQSCWWANIIATCLEPAQLGAF